MFDHDNMFDNEIICPIDGESDKNENISNSEDVTDSNDNLQNQTKLLLFKNKIVTIITKNIQKF